MTEDEFSKHAGKAFQSVALGVTGLVGGPASVALAASGSVLFNIFDAVANANSQAFQDARIATLEDEVRSVAEKVAKMQAARTASGKPVSPPDAPTQARVFSEFAEAVAGAATSEKRTALVHAAACQFNPDLGTIAVRKHWFSEVSRLTDMGIFALRVLAREQNLIFTGQHKVNGARNQANTFLVLQLSDDEHVALRATVLELSEGPYVSSPPPTQGRPSRYKLSVAGKVLARYIDDDATPEESDASADD